MSQKERMIAIARKTGMPWPVLGAMLLIQRFLLLLSASNRRTAAVSRRETPLTLAEFRESQRRARFAVARNSSIAGLLLVMLLIVSAGMVGPQAAADDGQKQTATEQLMLAAEQDMMVMRQNTAVWTANGLVILQGNRLLQYSRDLQLKHTIALPLPLTLPTANPGQDATAGMTPGQQPTLRSQVAAQILPTAEGLVVVRGQQVIWLDSSFAITGQATLPDLPPLNPAELMAVCMAEQPMLHGATPLRVPRLHGIPMEQH